jgi:alpha-tubulin suppressor-like RCC1 family protein
MWSWGIGATAGNLGLNELVSRSSPVQIGALTIWSQVAASSLTSFAIKTDGTLWSWGKNNQGQLGQNIGPLVSYRSSPVQVGALTTWSQIAGGADTIFARQTNGTIWAWGAGSDGIQGVGTVTEKSSPVQIGTDTNWSTITGGDAGFAIKSTGALYGWGDSDFGQLGINALGYRSSPVQVGEEVYGWSKVANGNTHTIATKNDGTLWSWGRGSEGQQGTNSVLARSSPVQIGALTTWSNVACGYYYSIATKTDGTLWAWGQNNYGQVATPGGDNKSSPIQVGVLTTWSLIAGGAYHTLATKTDGTMWLWGRNNYGAIGTNNAVDRSSPVQVGSDTNWSKITGGRHHSAAVKTTGTAWGWGYNFYGNFGDGTVITRSSPVQIGAQIYGWSQIAGAMGADRHSMALKADGTMWTWGYNTNGQIGDNTVIHRSSPVQVGLLTTWSQIAGGGLHSIALKTDGTIWTWGQNDSGQLGQNNLVVRSSPVQVGVLTTWSKIAGGGSATSLAIKTDGTMWTWGDNSIAGSMGDNTVITKSSPIQIGALNTWSLISVGGYTSIAINISRS